MKLRDSKKRKKRKLLEQVRGGKYIPRVNPKLKPATKPARKPIIPKGVKIKGLGIPVHKPAKERGKVAPIYKPPVEKKKWKTN